ncbi:hypothetical protein HK104_005420, partial [Borealophlyctis nickersoniae]
ALIADLLLDESEIATSTSLTPEQKKSKVTASYIRAASNGDIAKVKELVDGKWKEYVDLDGRDEDGTTALVYAACFGHTHVAMVVLEAGAKVDECDQNGWTPLMWACSNGHSDMARILISFGASKTSKSHNGRSVKDFVRRNKSIVDILESESESEDGDKAGEEGGSVKSERSGRSGRSGSFGSEEGESAAGSVAGSGTAGARKPVDLDDETFNPPFDYTSCPFNQMLVFDENTITHILHIAIVQVRPARGTSAPHQPLAANILFLCARFAHWYNSKELLDLLFERAVEGICEVVRAGRDDSHLLAWWISNCTQLLYYLKKDSGLCISSIQMQFTLSELIHELYQLFLHTVETHLTPILDAALIVHVSDEEGKSKKNVKLENVISGFFGRRKSVLAKKSMAALLHPIRTKKPVKPIPVPAQQKPPAYTVTPRTVAAILTATVRVLQSCSVHPDIINTLFQQIMWFVNCQVFNRVMTTRAYCCRSKAAMIRINLAAVEEWVRDHEVDILPLSPTAARSADPDPTHTLFHLRPTLHLLQFLQILTSIPDLPSFLTTLKSCDAITMPQVRAACTSYRYEVGEPSVSGEVEDYILGVCEEMVDRERERLDFGGDEEGGGFASGVDDEEGGVGRDIFAELLDGEYLLPFCVPQEGGDGVWPGPRAPFVHDEVMALL